ncbi:MAG: hypothetical protein Fur002_01480 [Anaerolineales bacterium]
MRSGRTIILVLVVILVLGGGGLLAFLQLQKNAAKKTAETAQPASVEVYIAKQPIPQGVAITDEVLGTMKLPPENVIGVMYQTNEKATLIGKIAKFNIDQGTPITESMVSDSVAPISGPAWATNINIGMTAVTLPASRLMLGANSVAKGAHVNIIACLSFVDIDPAFQTILPNDTAQLLSTGFLPDTLTALTLSVGQAQGSQGRVELDPSLQQPYYLVPSEKTQRPRTVCQMMLQDTVVMEVGNFTAASAATTTTPAGSPTPAPKPQAQQAPQQEPPAKDLVTLIVSPQDAITLTYLMYSDAQLTLLLRNPTDQARLATEAVTLQFLLSQYNIPVPAKLPYSMDMNFMSKDGSLNHLRLDTTMPPQVPTPKP